MNTSPFTYYMHDGPAAFSFELAGVLSVDDAAELEQAWLTASSTIGDRILVVDLSFVTRIDEAGRDLLRRWHQHGARLVANSPTAQLLAESIIGAPLPAVASAPAPTYAPFFTQLTRRSTTLLIVILLTLLHPATALALVEDRVGKFLGDLAENGILRDTGIREDDILMSPWSNLSVRFAGVQARRAVK